MNSAKYYFIECRSVADGAQIFRGSPQSLYLLYQDGKSARWMHVAHGGLFELTQEGFVYRHDKPILAEGEDFEKFYDKVECVLESNRIIHSYRRQLFLHSLIMASI